MRAMSVGLALLTVLGACGGGSAQSPVLDAASDPGTLSRLPGQAPPGDLAGLDAAADSQPADAPGDGQGAFEVAPADTGSATSDGSNGTLPQPETCNGVDDDHDGEIDNGFRTRVMTTSFSMLGGVRAECKSIADGRECDVAAHRTCKEMGCVTSGVISQSSPTAAPRLTCVIGEIKAVSFTALRAQFPSCDGVRLYQGFPCQVAVHRYCQVNGFAAGFGPIEWQSVGPEGMAQGVCLARTTATVQQTSKQALAALEAGCQYATTPQSYEVKAACNAASTTHCQRQGFEGGFGPVEASGDTAIVVCLKK